MIPLFKHYVAPEAAHAVAGVLASSCIGEGPVTQKFEDAITSWIGPNVVVSSGTAALWLAYDLAGITRDDIVISTPVTCAATNIPLAHLGARILWADVDPATGLIDPHDVYHLLKSWPRVRAVVSVDYGGALVDYAGLSSMCDDFNVPLIADCAHSFGHPYSDMNATYRAYSYQAIKFLTSVNGGSLCCQSSDKMHDARLKRWFGLDRSKSDFRCDQTIELLGYKSHMSDVEAAIGLANLPHIKHNIMSHCLHAQAYNQAGLLDDLPARSMWWLYNIKVPDRSGFIRQMAKRGVQCAQTHARNDRHPIFANAIRHEMPGVIEYDTHQVSIPVGWWLTDEDVQHVIQSVREALGR